MQVIHKKKKPPAQMTIKDLLTYVRDLEAENARLEESFQRAKGEIAADPLPSAVVDREKFNKIANDIGKNIKDDNNKMAIAVFVNELEEKFFGGADNDNHCCMGLLHMDPGKCSRHGKQTGREVGK